jgi:hypothetical protein
VKGVPCPTNKGVSYTNFVSGLVVTLKIDYYYYYYNIYSLDSIFHKESKSAIRIDMRALVLNLLKIEICEKSSWKGSKRFSMSQGSIMCAPNMNMGPGAQIAKKIKFLHVTRKSVLGLESCKYHPYILRTALNCQETH